MRRPHLLGGSNREPHPSGLHSAALLLATCGNRGSVSFLAGPTNPPQARAGWGLLKPTPGQGSARTEGKGQGRGSKAGRPCRAMGAPRRPSACPWVCSSHTLTALLSTALQQWALAREGSEPAAALPHGQSGRSPSLNDPPQRERGGRHLTLAGWCWPSQRPCAWQSRLPGPWGPHPRPS